MVKFSTYELALVIGGFIIGAAFITTIFRMWESARSRRHRRHRRYHRYGRGDRRYYGGDEEDEEEEDSNVLPMLLILVLLGGAGVVIAQKMGVFQTKTQGGTTKQSNIVEEPKTDTVADMPSLPVQHPDANKDQGLCRKDQPWLLQYWIMAGIIIFMFVCSLKKIT